MAQPDSKPAAATVRRATVPALQKLAREGTPLAMLTCYDASFAGVCERAGVDILLVGDTLGMVVQGQDTTLPVTVEDVAYHVRAVVRGCRQPLVVADLPFGSYQGSRESALGNAVRLLQAGAQVVKLEGGAWLAPTIAYLVERGVPVCGHIGLLPQSVNVVGGYKVQGKTSDAADALVEDARAVEAAGAAMIVVECVPRALGARLQESVSVPIIGIGAGPDCAGQVLVLYDALGIQPTPPARFVRNFMKGGHDIESAIGAYVRAVKDRSFPAAEHCF